ncbi:MAG: hypothetical protein IT479_02730 [Xanthomonadales bacterium]|nr:hypothetical protein [Xanthomonadales bacterium]MCC6592165.1 hypothetical protein [Xanthomonadales bacterium]MCE7931931.1 hypothetical protein [Xanthomonadales bacterium PRO6]
MRRVLAVLLMIGLGPFALARSPSFSSLEERMSAQDFRQAGLDKLSEAELAALNAWIERNVRLADPTVAAAAAQDQPSATAPTAGASMVGFENARREEFGSRILGAFKGWSGKTEFHLENGQVWQQVENDRYIVDLVDPAVTIKPGAFGSWRLKIEGLNRTTLVKRIR